ncbi:hypothetical protein GCM10022199_16300 [Marihabitans asiaticum]|uniref:Ion channel n=1 Tax=Marihabitans asiaticum TaxID=415218 RepID=A0A560W7R9_9MICO|nr:two pore domain potassium channel family protein [Marihabitans asiaticum]TWD13683.1 hypothetical protein FB557_2313 [Marihabitans asiaticum]
MTQSDWYAPPEPLSGREYWSALIRKQPSAVLLAVQIFAIVAMPWVDEVPNYRVALVVLSLVALTLAVWTVRATSSLTWVALLIGVPALGLELWTVFDAETWVLVTAHLLLASFYFYTGYALLGYIFADRFVTKDELFAVGAAFTVGVFAFTYLFVAIQEAYPGSFTNLGGDSRVSFQELLYGSVANFTGVGSTDIIGVRPHARAAVMVEQISGVFYIAMVISRLVAMAAMRSK